MSNCIVLGDKAVHEILISLSKDDTLTFLDQIAASLRNFSVGDERSYQPESAVINRPDGRKTLFRPFTSPTGVGVKIIVDPRQALESEEAIEDAAERNRLNGLHGVLTLCDHNGFPSGFVNAEELTGYRTSMSAMILYVKRKDTANIVVFGAGKQALWHLRLALVLRGDEIKRITIINRSAERTLSLLAQIAKENEERRKAEVELAMVDPGDSARVESVLGQADVVFCTTPSKEVLFPARFLTERKTDKGCYVSAIGSWQANMIELDPVMLKEVAKRGSANGIAVVDNRDECMKSAGEVVQSHLRVDEIMEVGEILDSLTKPSSELQEKTKRCLETEFVVYKSIGVSMTDLAAGQAVLEMAKKRRQGVLIPDF